MKMIELSALSNGAHRNMESSALSAPPEGWAMIPEEMALPDTYPFVGVEAEEIDGVMTVTALTPGTVPAPDLEQLRAGREAEISAACNGAIVAGMDVETSRGTEHFALQETDQINLTTALSAVQAGAAGYPYHADGQLCRMFTAEEIQAIARASVQHKLYHTTLCNHLLTWVRRAATAAELETITYTAEGLPDDLAANMAQVLAAAQNV